MEYEKPVCSTIPSACTFIRHQLKCLCVLLDTLLDYTMGAYEADE
jgi:hypothetical protein